MKDANLLSAFNRETVTEKLQSQEFDLLIVGGGITGAGIALDAASRGYSVALVEKNDFASGTSSRSTKLIHGGLRYLKQFEIALVREVGQERATVHQLAPHLVVSEKMLLPLIKGGTYGKIATSFGLMVYDVLAGVERADQRVMLSKEETLASEPLLDDQNLEGSGLYAEYRTDDARLTIEVAKTAAQNQAVVANYMEATAFTYDKNKKITGAICRDYILDRDVEIKAKHIVSAAGPWVDQVRSVNNKKSAQRLYLTKGVHLVVPHKKLPVQQAIYFDVPDGRMIFAIPRQGITYIGTTDTPYQGDINHVTTEHADAKYLIDAVNHMFPDIELAVEDVVSSWAGLRPLIFEEGKSASELSRKDEIFESSSGLISIAGGKLTGYRKMAERITELVEKRHRKQYGGKKTSCHTHKIPLANGGLKTAKDVKKYRKELYQRTGHLNLKKRHIKYLVSNYGRQTDIILAKMLEMTGDSMEEVMIKAELWFCMHHESVHTAMDFFCRRTGRLYFDIESIQKLMPAVLNEMQSAFKWSDERKDLEKAELETAIYEVAKIFKEPVAGS